VLYPTELSRLDHGAGGGIRSPGLLITDQPLSHLSYTSVVLLRQSSPHSPQIGVQRNRFMFHSIFPLSLER
jgi:hypothetical protein